MTQIDVVFEHLQDKELSSMEAFEKYGITRLSAIIFNLRKYGHKIDSNNKLVTNRYGRHVWVSNYKLDKRGYNVTK